MSLVDQRIESDWIQTPAIERPQPSQNEPAVELDLSDVPKDATRWVGHSGGRDSHVLTHWAMSNGEADGVVYCDTGSGLVENLEFVREMCQKHGWPLVVVPPRKGHEFLACRYGFAGPDYHSVWFNYVKGGGWRKLANHINGELELITGVYRDESDKRVKSISGKRQESTNFKGYYVSPWFDKTESDFDKYLDRHNLEKNHTYETINRSGDCYCLAYAGREEIVQLAKHYPEHYCWLMNVERRVQEYRGRIKLLEDVFPNAVEYARDGLRKRNGTPYPLLDKVIDKHLPALATWAKDQSRRKAVLRGMQEATCWMGHGGESSERLKRAAEQADTDQLSICEMSCNKKSVMGLDPVVEEATEAAEKQLQTELGTYV